jgi:choline dehydrogenase-like flavoprotein
MTHDLLVIGGGINGAGIARDAAGRGLSVILVEKGDLAGATSSASSKLIHGGLRYLEHFEFRLVAEALAEREILLHIAGTSPGRRFVAPHLPAPPALNDPRQPFPVRPSGAPRCPDRRCGSTVRLFVCAARSRHGFVFSDCHVDVQPGRGERWMRAARARF